MNRQDGDAQKPSESDAPRRKAGRPSQIITDRLDEELLDLAIQALRASNFTEVSFDRLAARIGVTKPTLYRRFASKEALLTAVVERELARLFEPLPIDINVGADRLCDLRIYARRLFMNFLLPSSAALTRLLVQESAAYPSFAVLHKGWHRHVLSQIKGCLEEVKRVGFFQKYSIEQLSNLLIDLIYTPITMQLLNFTVADVLTGLSPDEFFDWRFSLFENLANIDNNDSLGIDSAGSNSGAPVAATF
jgi:AcrR family transcriptional regulator